MTGPVWLPTCSVRYPACGACGSETDYDGDSLYCDPCGLDYGDGTESKPATYYHTADAKPCGARCRNPWHGSPSLGPYDCTPCQLPAGHKAAHWTACRPSPKETP